MTNQDQAARVIEYGATRDLLPIQIAMLLSMFNLLASDLPDPTPCLDGALEWNDGEVWTADDETGVYTELPKSTNWMTPNQARKLAHALLAAANHAEEA